MKSRRRREWFRRSSAMFMALALIISGLSLPEGLFSITAKAAEKASAEWTVSSTMYADGEGLAMTMDPIFQFGKNSLTPENTKAIAEALEARELIKINVLQNCADDPKEIAQIVAERTHSQVVQVIGKKIVLYKESKDNKKIELPKDNKKK